MEVPKIARLSPTRIGFRAQEIRETESNQPILRLPWGEIPMNGSLEEIYQRLLGRGFKEEYAGEILFSLFGVSSETPISPTEFLECLRELDRSEVRK